MNHLGVEESMRTFGQQFCLQIGKGVVVRDISAVRNCLPVTIIV